jgi:hypothetical protein
MIGDPTAYIAQHSLRVPGRRRQQPLHPRGPASPACSARLQQFVRGNPASIPSTNPDRPAASSLYRSRGFHLHTRTATYRRKRQDQPIACEDRSETDGGRVARVT